MAEKSLLARWSSLPALQQALTEAEKQGQTPYQICRALRLKPEEYWRLTENKTMPALFAEWPYTGKENSDD